MRTNIFLVLFAALLSAKTYAYLIILNDTTPQRSVIFDGTLSVFRQPLRKYFMNVDKSASFVEKLLFVNSSNGEVSLRQSLSCDRSQYPNFFTLYIDSSSSGVYEYISVPLKIFVRGCEFADSNDAETANHVFNNQLAELKLSFSESLVSYALPGTSVPAFDPIWETCFRKSQLVLGLGNSIIPRTIVSRCKVHYLDVMDPRLSIETSAGDLVAAYDFCTPLDPPWKVKIVFSYECSEDEPTNIVYPTTHYLKIVFWHRREKNEVGRVRRDLQNGGSTDSKMPQFEKPLYVASVNEEQPAGANVCTVHAKSVEGGEISYQMIPLLDGRSHSMFAINSETGLITTSVSLDREQLDVHYFRIQAVDLSYRPYSATTTLQINVLDINDYAPLFEAVNGEYEASVRESISVGSIVTTVRATDKDIGRNSEIEYSIKSVDGGGTSSNNVADTFSLDSVSGVLTTRLPLDREITEVYTIVISATDKALPVSDRKSSTGTIVAKILDENDNYPQFIERTYTVSVPEDTNPNTSPKIVTIQALDADQGLNAAIRYAIIGGNTQGQFSIDSQNGEVSLAKPLDYETLSHFNLIIRAQDGGSPSRSNTTQLLVNVKDVNDNAPRFYVSLFQESVAENVPIDYNIVRVQAYDADEGENAQLKYSMAERDSQGTPSNDLPIAVDETTGWIHTKRALDREINGRYSFQVVVQDNGIPPKYATANVAITVQDVNDNDPIFNPKNYEAVVSESDPPGTPVVNVVASDPDENPRLHYEILNGNTRGRFSITTLSGKGLVTIAQPLDYKQEKRFLLTVRAVDVGGRFDTATIYINVSDANNFAPAFENAPYTASVSEDVPLGTTVLVVAANDNDVGQNAQITYSLVAGLNEAPEFTINSQTGAIITTRQLDREVQSGYQLTVTAKDGGLPALTDTTDVEITVSDVNDNKPVFLKQSYSGSISEDALVGTSVLQVSATDVDLDSNGRLRYALKNSIETFVVDATSGVIRTAAPLDRESISLYELHVLAIDRGVPSMSSSVLVIIRIDDVNDSPPAFESDKLTFYVAENSPIGSLAGVLHARDPDDGANAVIQYSIIGGEDANAFSLVRKQGSEKAELLTLVELDYESQKKKYDLVVRAASSPLRNDAHVEILVTDVNDNAPKLKNFQVIFNNFKDYFPIGPIGRIPAFDADVSDKLRYRILAGNNANLVHLNESTGHLTLSPLLNTNVQKTAFINVSVTDGLNEVKAVMQLMVRLVTDEMLFSSVTVRFNEMTQEAFMSPLLTYFTEGLSAIIPCPKENIYIFSILEDTDVDGRILNVSFSARKLDGSFYSSQFLQEKVYLNRMILAKLSTLQVLPFDDNLCLREPCLNYEQCLSVLKFGNASDFLYSDSLLFRPIYPVSTFVCECPTGYTGSNEHYLCDTEVNLCYSNPCQHGGTCERKEGGYACVCADRYTGDNCEIDLSHDKCRPGVCHSGSICVPLTQGGFVCDNCSPNITYGDYDSVCQLRGRSFTKNSFLTFSSLKQRNRLHISMKFATFEDSGLLLYNGRYNELHDFIALELTDGGQTVQFSFSLGTIVTKVSASSPGGLNDGNWHTVTVFYFNRTATISLDDCDTVLTMRYGIQLGYLCANQSVHILEPRCSVLTETCHRFLDLTGPLQIGGLPLLPSATLFQVQNRDFVGCITDVYIDHKLLDFNAYVADYGTVVGCPEKQTQCTSQPCQNGGTCVESWKSFYCECVDGWSGKDCSQNIGSAWHFHGEGILSFNPQLRPVQLPWLASLSIRTLQQNAFVMCIQIGQGGYAIVSLNAGYLVYVVDGQIAALTTSRLNDGQWHRVEIEWLTGGGVRLSLDYNKRAITKVLNAKIQGLYVGKITLGKLDDVKVENIILKPFVGCIQDVRVGSNQSLQNPTEMTAVTKGCDVANPCSTNVCPIHSTCVAKWEKYTCQCHKGYVGPSCNHVCETNPCFNDGKCVDNQELPKGYKCVCNADLYAGDYCEVLIEQGCPVSWWGHPVCGPCNCPANLGYHPDCNKTTGECYCQENHYKPINSDRCLPCECYKEGSLDSTCDFLTGQCRCRPKVIGLRCDMCPNDFAEVTLNGCRVVYDGCPRNFANGVWWSRTEFGRITAESCPVGSHGKASRLCDNTSEGWQTPDVFNCTSDSFMTLRKLLIDLENEKVQLNTFIAIEAANQIRKACNNSELLYGADILITKQIIQRLLMYEAALTGLNLTHSQDKDYMQNVILGISRITDQREQTHWIVIKKLINETPDIILRAVWEYLVTLTMNQRDTYTDPFEVVTSNLVFGLDVVTPESLFGFESDEIPLDSILDYPTRSQEKIMSPDSSSMLESSLQIKSLKTGSQILGLKSATGPTIIFPKYNNYLMDKSKFDPHSQIMIPVELLGVKLLKKGEESTKETFDRSNDAVIGYAQYKNLGSLLPMRYDDTVSKRYGIELLIGSSIISVLATINHQTVDQFKWKRELSEKTVMTTNLLDVVPLPTPIRLRIWLSAEMITPHSNPQCVRWTTIRGFGEWTRAGCLTTIPDLRHLRKSRTPILINCTCNQLSTFAVLVDEVGGEYVTEFTFLENVVSWVTFWTAISAISLAWILLNLLRAQTNSSSICINHTFCLLVTQYLFFYALKSKVTMVSDEFSCKMIAIGLHYIWLSVMSWSLVSSLHLYRMLTEMRDVNHGQMGFYHSLGYGLPAVIVGLSVGVRADQYGNYFFCWLSLYESIVWSLVGSVGILVACNLIVLLLSLRAAFTLKDHVAGYGNLRTLLWLSVIALPLLVSVWMLELIVATERDEILTYLLSVVVIIQSCFTLGGTCFGNARVRASLCSLFFNLLGRKIPPIPDEDINSPVKSVVHSTHNPTTRSSLAYRNTGVNTFEAARRQIGISTSSTTSRSTNKTNSSPYRSEAQVRHTSTSTSNYEPTASDGTSAQRPVQHTSDSDSEASAERHSLDLASSHSSDEEESHRSSRRSKNVGVSTARNAAHISSGYLPNVIEDSIIACSGSPVSRLSTVQPPSHLNVVANSQLFSTSRPYGYSSSRWNGQMNEAITEDELSHSLTWIDSKASEVENNAMIASYVGFEQPKLLNVGQKFMGMDDYRDYEEEKYSFPYTAEEDHRGSSSFKNLMERGAELSGRKMSGSQCSNVVDLSRSSGGRVSVRSGVAQNGSGPYEICDYNYPGSELPVSSFTSLDCSGDNILQLSSQTNKDRKHTSSALDELSSHQITSKTYDPSYCGNIFETAVNCEPDQVSVRSCGLRRGSNLSLRSDENTRYGLVLDRDSRRESNSSLLGTSTLPMQRRPFNVSNEYCIANISESEKDTNEETRV